MLALPSVHKITCRTQKIRDVIICQRLPNVPKYTCRLTFDPGYLDAIATEANAAGPRLVAPCSLSLIIQQDQKLKITSLCHKDWFLNEKWNTHTHPPSSRTLWSCVRVVGGSRRCSVGCCKPRPAPIYGHSRPAPSPWEWEAYWCRHHISQPVDNNA